MRTIYALEPIPKCIFLAGPTPRNPAVPSWRPQALKILEQIGYEGDVLVPESSDWNPHSNYNSQIEWEWRGLDRASVVVFWIPRDLVDMPAFTTNIEFGMMIATKKVVLGFPQEAKKIKYLEALARRYDVPVFPTLEQTLVAAAAR